MKPANIYSLTQAASSLNEDVFGLYLEYHGIKIRKNELNDLKIMITTIKDLGAKSGDFDKFYVGYKIPQIGKEFDLLRFGKDLTINIELKSISNTEQIKSQLLRNKYYLSFISKSILLFTFESNSGKLYLLNENNNLEEVHPSLLLAALQNQTTANQENPDLLFDPSNYLVSPFNSTNKFLEGNYFLTQQQEEIKNQIISFANSISTSKFISITGSAGTGKTLLTFDIAKHFITQQNNILIIHYGKLNNGHLKLIELGWKIIPIVQYASLDFNNFDMIIIDEAQRLYKGQLDKIIERANNLKYGCIFSYDKNQTLSKWEENNDITRTISNIPSAYLYELSEKIRTNKDVSNFIKMLFNEKRSLKIKNTNSIKINYFSEIESAKNYIAEESLTKKDWKVLRFTPSQFQHEYHQKYFNSLNENSHEIIGQEFENVAIIIDQFFSYDENGNLIYQGKSYYEPTKMLFQNITRARKNLNLIIINNQRILLRCLKSLTNHES